MEKWVEEKLRAEIKKQLDAIVAPLQSTVAAHSVQLNRLALQLAQGINRIKQLEAMGGGGLTMVHEPPDQGYDVTVIPQVATCPSCGSAFVQFDMQTDGTHLICNGCGCQR